LTSAELLIGLKKDDELEMLLRHMDKTKIGSLAARRWSLVVQRGWECGKEAGGGNARENKKYRTLQAVLQPYQAQRLEIAGTIVKRMCEEVGAVAAEADARSKGRESRDNVKEGGGLSGSVLGPGREFFRHRGLPTVRGQVVGGRYGEARSLR
jgi:hypothetical protein